LFDSPAAFFYAFSHHRQTGADAVIWGEAVIFIPETTLEQ